MDIEEQSDTDKFTFDCTCQSSCQHYPSADHSTNQQKCIQISLSQRDFANSDLVMQILFLYVLKNSGAEDTAKFLEGDYHVCKHFSAYYSVGYNHSLKIRIAYTDQDKWGLHQEMLLTENVRNSTILAEIGQKEVSLQNEIFTNYQSTQPQIIKPLLEKDNIDANNMTFHWICEILRGCSSRLLQEEMQKVKEITDNIKIYLDNYHSRMQQVKRYHVLSEKRLQEICENRLRLMEKLAKEWVAKHCEETDFVLIKYIQADFSAERQRMKQTDLNAAFLSLLGTESQQFTSLIMRNGMQVCHKETNITDFAFGIMRWLMLEKEDQYEFTAKNQKLVLIDKVITTCDTHSVCFRNIWNEQEPFVPKQTAGQYMALDAVVVSRFFLPPEQIKEILAIRMEHQSLDLVSIQEASIDYTVQSETFCEKFYPEVKAEFDKIDKENNQYMRVCLFKELN